MSDNFPLDSYREAAPHLRRPFTAAAVKFKVQSTTGNNKAMIVSYIDARLVVERLNLVIPHLWHDEYAQVDERTMLCKLTVDGITRQDLGEGAGKGLFSDALKRAAVKFGIGVSLYSIPRQWLPIGGSDERSATKLRSYTKRNGETVPVLTDANEGHLRGLYSRWLEGHGIKAFGEPLDHGDQDGSQGDAEAPETEVHPADAAPPEKPSQASQPPPQPRVDPDSLDALRRRFKDTGWTPETLAMQLTAVGAQDVSDVRAAMQALSPEQARQLLSSMNSAVDEQLAAQEALRELEGAA